MQLIEFNEASADECSNFLKHCVQIPRWADEIIVARPYATLDAVLTYAAQQAANWTWQDIQAALDKHPRIGEKKAQADLTATEEAFSKREQAAIRIDAETQAALLQGNIAYEKKYGHIFLIKASGLSSQEVLQALNYRLNNDVETEKRIVHHQLSQIALLRLSQELYA